MPPNSPQPHQQPPASPMPPDQRPDYVSLQHRLPQLPQEPPRSESTKSILSTLAIIIIAPFVALLLTVYVFKTYEVDGPSMSTTLHNNDLILVLKLPKTIAQITNNHYIPKRGEIIVFYSSRAQGSFQTDNRKQLIKRVIGIPGDRVIVRDGLVTVYNKDFPEGFNPDKVEDHGDNTVNTSGTVDITVKQNEVFVLGDNRANSLDSRAIGTIPSNDIIGELAIKIFPLRSSK
jgi:signal peptidase I